MDLTWTCHVCGEERPDAQISALSTPRLVGAVEVAQNVRYCNDRPACVAGARDVDFFGPTFSCPQCRMVSHNPYDRREGYCGNCHAFTGVPVQAV